MKLCRNVVTTAANFQHEAIMEYPEFSKMEREGWANPNAAGNYRDLFSPITDQAIAPMLALIAPAPKDVLDSCCGHGSISGAAHAAGITGNRNRSID